MVVVSLIFSFYASKIDFLFLDINLTGDNHQSGSGTLGKGGILEGVVICVAKSLSDRQIALNDLVKQLGGDFRWNIDKIVSSLL